MADRVVVMFRARSVEEGRSRNIFSRTRQHPLYQSRCWPLLPKLGEICAAKPTRTDWRLIGTKTRKFVCPSKGPRKRLLRFKKPDHALSGPGAAFCAARLLMSMRSKTVRSHQQGARR